MNKTIKKAWLKALRSGDYTQGVGNLRSAVHLGEDEFCCLGVLCDLYAKEYETDWHFINHRGEYNFFGTTALLPDRVSKWAKLYEADPDVETEMMDARALSDINDDGYNFEDIAELIEDSL